jgi:hypothetical protein
MPFSTGSNKPSTDFEEEKFFRLAAVQEEEGFREAA